jgi:Xaa-Pro aminopeptidase
MFQSFCRTTRPEDGPPRLAALRAAMKAEGLAGFLIPRADAHQGEYVAEADQRLAWLTGFTGSAGFCIALHDIAGVFADGRYRVQVRAEIDASAFTPVDWPETKPADWLKAALPQGGRIGFDPWLHTKDEIGKLETALEGTEIALSSWENLIDRIWENRPAPPLGKVEPFPEEIAGRSSAEKRAELAAALTDEGQRAAVLTLPDGINWLLNIRGSDIPRNPIAQANAILHEDGRVDLFVAEAKLVPEVRAHLGAEVAVAAPSGFAAALEKLQGPVRVDKASAPLAVSRILEARGIAIAWGRDPTLLPKARKNTAELAATEQAHLRDGAAMAEFLAWLDDAAPKGGLTEIDVVKKLEGFRRASNALREISFDTICGAGPNGAIVHYRVTEETNRPVKPGELLLIDSGGQYLDGTTDITRTVAVGEAGRIEKECFTRVLQGMIAVSRLRFPKGLSGQHLDAIARYPLWLAGQDYDHGTGHGVGVYLSVHEGPAGIARRYDVPFEPGMILSNEPGYYRESAFGIRIENLVAVEPAPPLEGADSREMLSFRTLTYAPIDRRLILRERLSGGEIEWLNTYHAAVFRLLAPRVSPKTRAWLEAACTPI